MLCYAYILREQFLNCLAWISLHLENNWNQTLKGYLGKKKKEREKKVPTFNKKITNMENA